MKLYVIGPVTGCEDLNRRAFEDAKERLWDAGYDVLIPHGVVPPDATYEDAMRTSIKTMLECDGVALLEGWTGSKGASFEKNIATVCGLRIHPYLSWVSGAASWAHRKPVDPENDNSPEETQNQPSDGVPAPSNEVLGALARRMDETNALLRAVYNQISALITLETCELMKLFNRSTGELVDSSLKAVSRYTEISDAYFRSAGRENQDDREA